MCVSMAFGFVLKEEDRKLCLLFSLYFMLQGNGSHVKMQRSMEIRILEKAQFFEINLLFFGAVYVMGICCIVDSIF